MLAALRWSRRSLPLSVRPVPGTPIGGQGLAEIGTELPVRATDRGRKHTYYEIGTRGQFGQPLPDQVPQLPADPVADNRPADRLRHDESGPDAGLNEVISARLPGTVGDVQHNTATSRSTPGPDRGRELIAATQPLPDRKHGPVSGRQADAPLGATRGDHRAAGPGPHTQPETVGLRAPAVVRLVGALAHCEDLPCCARDARRIARPAHGRSSRHSGYPVACVTPKGPTSDRRWERSHSVPDVA